MQSKKMVIELRDNEWYARGWKVNKDELITTIEHHVANNPEIPMELKVDAYSSYNSLFVIHESIYKVYAHLRKKAILKEFGVDYDSSAYFNEQIRFGQERLPMFLIYFSEEEQKLFEERKD